MKKLLILAMILALVFAACDNGNGNVTPPIGDTGPGGGTIFFAEGGQYKECSGELGSYNWTQADTIARNHKGGGFENWRLPDQGELQLMYQNLHRNGLGGFSNSYYWSSSAGGYGHMYLNFSNGDLSGYDGETFNVYRVRAVRSYTVSAPDTTPKTTLVINNLSDYDLFNADYASVDFGAIESGKNSTEEVSAGTSYIYFSLHTVNGDARCRTDVYTCEKDKQNEYVITNNTVITTTVDEQRGTLKGIFDELNKVTSLKMINSSSVVITDVIWNNIPFTGSQDAITIGSNAAKDVGAGSAWVYFKKQGNPVAVRTNAEIVVADKEQKEFVFTNDVLITEVGNANSSITDTLGVFFAKPWIMVKQNTDQIEQYGEYNYGSILPDEVKDVQFTVENIGGENLNFTNMGSRIYLEENAAGYFSITQQPLASSLASENMITFTIRFDPQSIGDNFTASVHIKTDSLNAQEFAFRIKANARNEYQIGDTGPGGGIIFFAEGRQYKECSGELGSYNRTTAATTARAYKGGNFNDWRLPDIGELNLIYENLHKNNIGGFSAATYWSSSIWSSWGNSYDQYQNFSTGSVGNTYNSGSSSSLYRVRAVRGPFSL